MKQRRTFSREFELEAVRLVRDRGVSVARAARDLETHDGPKYREQVNCKSTRRRRRPLAPWGEWPECRKITERVQPGSASISARRAGSSSPRDPDHASRIA
jgi:transposase-like protein